MCTSTQTTFSACDSKVKSLTRQCFNAMMGRNRGSRCYDSTQFVTENGLCITCTVRREFKGTEEQAKLAAAMSWLSLGERGEEERTLVMRPKN